MPDDEDAYLEEMLQWVHDHSGIPEIGQFLLSLAERTGETLHELAQEKPAEALLLAEALFDMIEDEYTPEQLRAYFKRNQPERVYDTELVLPP